MFGYTAYQTTVDTEWIIVRGLVLSMFLLGVIHFIMMATLVSLAFLKRPGLSLLLGVGIIVSYVLGYFHLDPIWLYSIEHFHMPEYTVDVVSFTPWFGVVLIGMFLMHKKLFGLSIQENSTGRSVAFLGKHPLITCLLHRPILFGVFNMIKFIR